MQCLHHLPGKPAPAAAGMVLAGLFLLALGLAGAAAGQEPAPAVDHASLKSALLRLYGSDLDDRVAAIRDLAEMRDVRLVPVFRALADSPDPAIRLAAIAGLGRLPDAGVVWRLRGMALDTARPDTERKAALAALAGTGTVEAADVLFDLASTLEPALAVAAEERLGESFPDRRDYRRKLAAGDAAAGPEGATDRELADLLAAFQDRALLVRRTDAARALGLLNDPRAVPALEAALGDPDPAVRAAAVEGLTLLEHPASVHALARCVAAPRLDRQEREQCVHGLMTQDTDLAATLLIDLGWYCENIITGDLALLVSGFVQRRLPDRVAAQMAETDAPTAAVEVELLLDLLQPDSFVRSRAAVVRSRGLKPDILPAIIPELESGSTAHEAILTVGAYDDPRSRAALEKYVARREHAPALRVIAAETLAAQTDEDAARRLVRLHGRVEDAGLKTAIEQALTKHHPEAARAASLTFIEIDREGVVPLMLAGGLHGAIGMVLLSEAANPAKDKSTFLPAMGGAILGAGVPLWLTLDEEVTSSQAFWVFSGGAWGLYEGALISYSLGSREEKEEPTDSDRRLGQAVALTGQAAGIMITWLTRDGMGRDAGQVAYMNSAVTAGSLGGLGMAMQAPDRKNYSTAAWMLMGSTAGLAGSAVFGPSLTVSDRDYLQLGTAMWTGGWTGGWTMEALNKDGEDPGTGGLLTGAALGFGVGSVLAGYTEPDSGFIGFLNASFLAGNVGGVGLLLQTDDPQDRKLAGWLLVPGWLSMLTAGVAGQDFRFSEVDYGQLFAAQGLGAWTGGWGLAALRPEHDTAAQGGILLGAAAGFGVGSVLAATTESPAELLHHELLGFGIGTSFGSGLGLAMPDVEYRYVELLMLAGGWSGFATAGATEDVTRFTDGDMAFTGLGGAWGLYNALALRHIAEGDSARTAWGATLLGSSTGLIVAGAVSQIIEPDMDQVGRAATGGVEGSIVGRGLGLLVPDLASGGVTGTMLSAGWSGLLLKGFYVPPADFTEGDQVAVLAGAGWGSFQGWLISTAAQLDSRQTEGAVTLGLGLGTISGEALGRAGDLGFSEVMFTEFSSYSGSGMGAGLTLLGKADSQTVSTVSALTGWGAKVVTGVVADRLVFRPDDTIEYAFWQGWGMWQGLGFAKEANLSDRRRGGATLVGLSSGFVVPMLTNQVHDYSTREDLMIMGGAAWGSWMGAWWPYALSGETGDSLLPALVGGDLGLLATGLVILPGTRVTADHVGWVHLFGLGGLALGASGTAIFTSDNQTIALGMNLATTAGLVAGMAAAPALASADRETSVRLADDDRDNGRRSAGLRIGNLELPLMYPATFVAPPPAGHPDAGPTILYGVEGLL